MKVMLWNAEGTYFVTDLTRLRGRRGRIAMAMTLSYPPEEDLL